MPLNSSEPHPWVMRNHGGKAFLGLPLPGGIRPLQLKTLAPGSQKLYWVIEGSVVELPLEGWIEEGGTTCLALPLPGGRGARPFPERPGKTDMIRLLSALAALETEAPGGAKPIIEGPLRTGGILLPEAGGTAFLEPDFARRIFSLGGGEGADGGLIHPALRGGGAALFSSAVLAYRSLSGEEPFRGKEEELRERIRQGIFPPLAAHVPAVDSRLAEWIHRGLLGGGPAEGAFSGGVRLFQAAGEDPALTLEEGENRRQAAEREGRRREKRYTRRRFFRRW